MLHRIYFLLIFLFPFLSTAQVCNYKLFGSILDEHDNSGLEYATVYIVEKQMGATADSIGNYSIENLCKGRYTVIVEHLGCAPDTVIVEINQNAKKNFYLEHHAKELAELTVTSNKNSEENIPTSNILTKQKLDQLQGKNLSEILTQISGVTQLKTGSNISKPIIHGMSGSRISIISNDTKLESQDWGTEHAPEIDPFNASTIKVIKGAGSVEYSTDAIGGIIIVEPPSLKKYKNIQAAVSLVTQSNGKGISGAAKLEQGFKKHFAYILQGTYKRSGDLSAPKYNLSNTGMQEGNMYAAFGFLKKNWNGDFSYSMFHQKIGIMQSAHIGNLSDLQNAIASNTPLIVKPFTYKIENPKQKITHHLAKASISKYLKNDQKLEINYAVQMNNRQEYDIRRGGRSNIPALDMHLFSNTINTSFVRKNKLKKAIFDSKTGVSFLTQHNFNNAATGVRPLIPDYYLYSIGLYDWENISIKQAVIEFGARYDYTRFKAFKFDKHNVLQTPTYNFHIYAFVLGINWKNKKDYFKIQSNISYSARFPNANELFSEGLHHGVAALEFGDENLHPERGIKWITTITAQYKKIVKLEASFYTTKIKDYIYIAPLPDPILTIRGAFPAFKYYQTNARLIGFDAMLESNPTIFLQLTMQTSIIRGKNTKANDYLIYMPADRITSGIELHHDFNKLKNVFVNITIQHVFKQRNTPINIIDYKPTPNAYSTLNAAIGWKYKINTQHNISFSISAENMTNTSYRDYLNRFRYYADEIGWNLLLRLNYTFN
ncbi:MAG: TonB-dependent receptor [Bacteroidetes bacterium]|nr:TonB-dependent receptor [Bacteroidota bacterium]